jgi:16S rRNA G966 N2-methylase RsmD
MFENNNKDKVKEWIILNQFGRRNLSLFQRSELVLELKTLYAEQAKKRMLSGKKPDPVLNSEQGRTNEILSKKSNVGHDTIAKVEKIKAKAPQEVIDNVRSGKITINRAFDTVIKKEKAEERKNKANESANIVITNTDCDFRFGEFYEVLSDIPDNSLDMILTDPPYPYDCITLWSELANFASQKLKDGGFCVAYSGQLFLPEVMKRMSEHLTYYWLCGLQHIGKVGQRFEVNLFNRFKPILIYQKGEKMKQKNWSEDLFISPQPDKQYHEWGQSIEPFIKLIELFEPVTICDPFTGGGCVPIACLEKKVKFIGAEIDTDTYNITKKRIYEWKCKTSI